MQSIYFTVPANWADYAVDVSVLVTSCAEVVEVSKEIGRYKIVSVRSQN